MKIYILDAFEPTGVQFLTQQCADVVLHGDPSAERWHDDATALMIRGTQLGERDFAIAKNLKLVMKQGVGTDNIDLDAAKRHGIMVCTMPGGVNSYAVAELALGLAMAVARRVPELDRRVRKGEKIVRPNLLGVELRGKSVGIIGMGHIGTESAHLFRNAFGCELLAYDPYAKADAWHDLPHRRLSNLHELLPIADIVTLHVPLTVETKHILDAKAIASLKPKAIVVNVSRGGLIDETALRDALQSNAIFGAGLDAFEEGEPPSKDNPLLDLPNVVATPHAGGGTFETQATSSLMTATQLWEIMHGGTPLQRVA